MTRRADGFPDVRVSVPQRGVGRVVWSWGPAVAMMTLIFFASALPHLGPLPGDVSDKTAHFAAYGVLGGLVLRALASARLTGVTLSAGGWAWVITAAYGATDELHQRLVPGRSPSVADWVADAGGAAVAVAIVLITARWSGAVGRRNGRDI